ncbi:MAG TPA: DUF1444 family protein [Pirellulales bacterium]
MGLFDRFSRQPTKDEFARLVMATLREIGDRQPATYHEAEFRLTFDSDGEETRTMYLTNLFGEYCRKPKNERNDFLRRACIGLANPNEAPEDFEDAKPDLLPTVRVRSFQEELRLGRQIKGANWVAFPSVPLSEHLEVCLVYDLPTTMHFVDQETLDNWGVSLYEAMEIARQNLAEIEFAIGALDEKLFIVVAGDAYDATRMLLVDQIRQLPLCGQVVSLPVTRDSLLLAGSDDIQGLGMMADMAEKKEDDPRPLCAVAHALVGDDWAPWLPPPEHPHHERFRLFALKHDYHDYAEQKKLSDKLHEQTGEDVFVATFSAAERDGKTRSYCVWTKDVAAWLPKTDYVFLYARGSERRWVVTWDRLQEVAGQLMSPLDCYPPRWFVDAWPTDEQIEALGAEDWG